MISIALATPARDVKATFRTGDTEELGRPARLSLIGASGISPLLLLGAYASRVLAVISLCEHSHW